MNTRGLWALVPYKALVFIAGNEEVLRPNLVGGEFFREQTPRFS